MGFFTTEDELKSAYSEQHLKKISAGIIDAYRNKNRAYLERLASWLDIDPAGYEGRPAPLFKELILFFHPDRKALIHNSIEKHSRDGNTDALEKLSRYIRWNPLTETARTVSADDTGFPADNSAGNSFYSQTDFSQFREDFHDETVSEETEEWYEFIEAVKDRMYGNMFHEFLPKDLAYLDGELILADEGISDLTGLEHCTNLLSLDLSRNRIENIFDLSSLVYLEKLDLSFNEIENIQHLSGLHSLTSLDLSFNRIEEVSELNRLQNLKYLNLAGNPLLSGSGPVRSEKALPDYLLAACSAILFSQCCRICSKKSFCSKKRLCPASSIWKKSAQG